MNFLRYYLIILTAFSVGSCQYFESEKISSETFYEQEVEAINWGSVDQYPLFPECEGLSDKSEQLECFTRILSGKLEEAVGSGVPALPDSVQDTIYLYFSVSETGELSLREITSDAEITRRAPKLDSMIKAKISETKLVAPAYKRGIPVKSEFTMPLIIMSERL